MKSLKTVSPRVMQFDLLGAFFRCFSPKATKNISNKGYKINATLLHFRGAQGSMPPKEEIFHGDFKLDYQPPTLKTQQLASREVLCARHLC